MKNKKRNYLIIEGIIYVVIIVIILILINNL